VDANHAMLNDVLVDMPNLIMFDSNYYIQLKFIVNSLGYGIKIAEGDEGYNYTITSDPTIIVFDTNKMIEYVGNWITIPSNMGAFGDTTTRSTLEGEEAILEFYGTGVKLYLARGAGAGICDIYIDGVKVTTFDSYSQTPIVKDLVYEIYGLEKGLHEIKIVNTGQKNASGIGTNINIDGIEIITRSEGAGLPILTAPVIAITDDVLTYNEVNGAIGYILQIGLHTINLTGNSVTLTDVFESNHLTSFNDKIYIYAIGDGETFNNSKLSNGLDYIYEMVYGSVEGITSRGAYTFDGNTLTQVEFTINNTYPFYDKVVYKTPYSDFEFNASLRSDFLAPTINSKFGLMIAASNNSYFNIFFLPENNTLYLLSTLDGGNTWISLWENVPCTFDANAGFDLKVIRVNQTIMIYVNELIVHTENDYIVDEDMPVYIGFISEAIKQVEYSNISIEGQENLKVPSVFIDNEIIEFYSDNAVSYLVKINEIEFPATSPFDINEYLNSTSNETGVYSISIKAIGDGVLFGDSNYSNVITYSHVKIIEGTEQLSTPAIILVDDVLSISTVQYAIGYTLKIEDGYQNVYTSSVSSGVNIRTLLIEEGFISGTFTITVQANGDSLSYSDSIFSASEELTIDASLTPIKGQYLSAGSDVTLEITGGILNADNYQTGYDKNYTNQMFTDIQISATIKFDVNIPNTSRIKFGLSFQENNDSFYYVFIDLNTNSVVLLVRQNSSWVSLWSVKFTPTIDLEEGVELSIKKVGSTVELFVNSIKLHTLENFTSAAVWAGLVSEAGNLIYYENVTIQIFD
jgi:hypothetical protein